MSFWLREVAGWLLVAVGLFAFWKALEFGRAHLFLEVWPIAIFGIFIFRGGIHLLKVAIAARVCREAEQRLYPPTPPGVQATLPPRPTGSGRMGRV
jgi:hypothetical protein